MENATTFAIIRWGVGQGAVGWLALAKLIFVAVALLAVLLSFLHRPRTSEARTQRTQTLLCIRLPLLAAGLVFGVLVLLPANVRDQLDDVLRAWRDRPIHGAAAGAAALLLCLALAAISTLLLRKLSGEKVVAGIGTTGLTAVFATSGLTAVAFGLFRGAKPWLFPITLGLVVFALLSALPAVRNAGSVRPAFEPQWDIVRVVAFLPAYAVVVAALHAEVGLGEWWSWRVPVLMLGVVGLIGVWILIDLVVEACRPPWNTPPPPGPILWTQVTALAAASAVTFATPHLVGLDDTSAAVGGLALVCCTALGLLLLGAAVELTAPTPRGLFAPMKLRRFPVITSVLALVVAATYFDNKPGFHRAETLPTSPVDGMQLAGALTAWRDQALARWNVRCSQEVKAQRVKDDQTCSRDVVPMFLVATSGGGIRAAYWTILVNDCIFGGEAPKISISGAPVCAGASDLESIALASGISGGSVGMAMSAVQARARPSGQSGADGMLKTLDERKIFEGGFLDRIVANLLYTDLPNAVFHAGSWRDRARALEVAFEDAVPALGQGLIATQRVEATGESPAVPHFPLLLLNSATVEDGCRMNVSVLRLAPASSPTESCRTLANLNGETVGPLVATRDLEDYLCPGRGDVRLSTAALLSARFPFVSPSGALTACNGKTHTFLVDGGYVDSSAASSISDLLPTVAAAVREWNAPAPASSSPKPGPCVQPVVLQIDNGYTDIVQRSDPSRPAELLAPIAGAGAAGGGRAESERQRLVTLANQLLENVGCGTAPPAKELPRYLHVYPNSHPGTQAPLGWALSSITQIDLEKRLHSSNNVCAIAQAKAWLSGGPVRAEACTG